MATTFEFEGNEYRIQKLSAIQQFHVSRRISPLIPPLIPVFMKIARDKRNGEDALGYLDSIGSLLQPFADGLASLKDEDAEYVFRYCLSAIQRRQGDSWVQIWNTSANMMIFEELNDISKTIPLVVRVIQDSLSPFIRGLMSSSALPEASN